MGRLSSLAAAFQGALANENVRLNRWSMLHLQHLRLDWSAQPTASGLRTSSVPAVPVSAAESSSTQTTLESQRGMCVALLLHTSQQVFGMVLFAVFRLYTGILSWQLSPAERLLEPGPLRCAMRRLRQRFLAGPRPWGVAYERSRFPGSQKEAKLPHSSVCRWHKDHPSLLYKAPHTHSRG